MSEVLDLEVGRYALRTFRFSDDDFLPILNTPNRGGWTREGTCVATCFSPPNYPRDLHEAPCLECECGIYGSHSLQDLHAQYSYAWYFVAVIAAEGKTIVGSRGLRTERARVVAYWIRGNSPNDFPRLYSSRSLCSVAYERPTGVHDVCRKSFGNAREWDNLEAMTEHFGLAIRRTITPTWSSISAPQYWTD